MSQFDWLLNCVCQWLHGGVGVVLGVVAGPIASALGRLEQQQPQQPQQVYRVWFSSLLLGCCSFFFKIFLDFQVLRFLYRVLPGFTGFPNFIAIGWDYTMLYLLAMVLMGFYWFLLHFYGFYRVLLGFTGFRGVILGCTEFYWV